MRRVKRISFRKEKMHRYSDALDSLSLKSSFVDANAVVTFIKVKMNFSFSPRAIADNERQRAT